MQNTRPPTGGKPRLLAAAILLLHAPTPSAAQVLGPPTTFDMCSMSDSCDPPLPDGPELPEDVPGRLTVRKSVKVLADPVNDVTNPKAIPGAFMAYDIEVENHGDGTIDADTQILQDPVPANMRLAFSDRFPMTFDARGSGLTLRHADRSGPNDDVEYSTDGGATWVHRPAGSDAGRGITNVRFRPKGAMRPRSKYLISVVYMIL